MGAETESSESDSEPELCVAALKRRVTDGRVTVGAVELVRALTGGTESAARKHLQRLMERYDASKGEWKRYAFWDCKTNYTRNLIATDQKTFTLMQLCWNPSKWRCVWALRCFSLSLLFVAAM